MDLTYIVRWPNSLYMYHDALSTEQWYPPFKNMVLIYKLLIHLAVSRDILMGSGKKSNKESSQLRNNRIYMVWLLSVIDGPGLPGCVSSSWYIVTERLLSINQLMHQIIFIIPTTYREVKHGLKNYIYHLSHPKWHMQIHPTVYG